jgi:transposase-like protein
MSKSILSAPHFNDEAAAYAYVEARVWPDGRVCPHCGVVDRSSPLKGKSNRVGLYKCYACRKPFTVKVGTIFEASHIALRDWLVAMYLLCSSKKGISSNQLSRTLGITVKSAWFMSHRIREAMRSDDFSPMGGSGGIIEIDETFFGRKQGAIKARAWAHKNVVLTLVSRRGSARSFHVENARAEQIVPIVRANIAREARLITDDARVYGLVADQFASHEVVRHTKGEYGRGDVHTNTIEGYFSIFKRGMLGVYQRCSEKHLHRYLAEYDFRYSNRIAVGVDDVERADMALSGIVGKRLTYRTARREVRV